jgi:hypothetical protein
MTVRKAGPPMAAFFLHYLTGKGGSMETQDQTGYRKAAAGFLAVVFLIAGMAVAMYSGLF